MKNIKYIFLFTLIVAFFSGMAQDDVDPARKQAIDSLALEKVRDLSKYISIIGSKDTQFSEAQRVMDRAEELFAPDSEMGVSSLSREEITYYKVREYFKRLMALNYDKVKISWYELFGSSFFVKVHVVLSESFVSFIQVPTN